MNEDFSNGKISTEQYDKFQKELQDTTQKSKELAQQQRNLEKQFKDGHISDEQFRDYQREVIDTKQKLKDLESQADKTKSKLLTVGSSLSTAGGKLKGSGEKLSNAGTAMTTGLTVPIVAAGVAATNAGINFEAQMSRVKAISEASDEDLEKMSSQAL
jgi:phage-related minor tail protein